MKSFIVILCCYLCFVCFLLADSPFNDPPESFASVEIDDSEFAEILNELEDFFNDHNDADPETENDSTPTPSFSPSLEEVPHCEQPTNQIVSPHSIANFGWAQTAAQGPVLWVPSLVTIPSLLVRDSNRLRLAIDTENMFVIFHIVMELNFPTNFPIVADMPVIAYAAASGRMESLRYLVQLCKWRNVDFNSPFVSQNILTCPLAYSATKGIFVYLIDQGADINFHFVDYQHQNVFNLLHWAILRKLPSLVKILVDLGANVSESTSNGYTTLQLADLVERRLVSNDRDLKKVRKIKQILARCP